MALFGKKKETKKESEEIVKQTNTSQALGTDHDLSRVVISPRLTEKSVSLGDQNVYAFNVRRDSTKFQVRDAIKSLYNVTPVKINIVNKKPAKRMVGSRGREKHVAGSKKAYVYLKKGDTINLV